MFNWNSIKKVTTLADLPLIEGYAEAVASPEKYVLHHRAEIQPDGVHCSRQWSDTKNSSSSKAETSSRMKDFWSVNREKMHKAFCARPAVYKDIYGLTKKQIADKLGKTCWAVEQLHKKGELKCFL